MDSPEPLAIWHREEHLKTISSQKNWRFSLSWIQKSRQLVTPHAYASFLLTWVSANAIEQGDRSAFWPLVKEAFGHGAPGALECIRRYLAHAQRASAACLGFCLGQLWVQLKHFRGYVIVSSPTHPRDLATAK